MYRLTAAALLAVLSLAACGGAPASTSEPATPAAAPEGDAAAPAEGEKAKSDIVDTAVAAGSFKTLVAAVQAAGLVDTLKGPGPFTVFAPTDDAFAKLPKSAVDELLKPENKEKLKAVLTYHVVSGKVMAADAKGLKSAKTFRAASWRSPPMATPSP